MPETASGKDYADWVASYLFKNYSERGITIYREVNVGKTIIGKNRRIDILVIHDATARALAIECKFQSSSGTTDEKIPYAIEDLRALKIPGIIVYAGEGFSSGVLHLLQSSDMAAYCMPDDNLAPSTETRELDHMLAVHFHWWDIVTAHKEPFIL